MSSFGKNNVAQQIVDENAQQAFKENEKFLKSLYDSNVATGEKIDTFKQDILLKMRSDLNGISNASSASDIGTALKALNTSLKELL